MKIIVAISFALFLCAPPAFGAAFLNQQNLSAGVNNQDNFTITANHSSASNLFVVGLGWDNDVSLSSISFGGVNADGFVQTGRAAMAYWISAPTGDNDLQAAFSGSVFGTDWAGVVAGEISDIILADPVNVSTTGTTGATNITTTNDNTFIFDFLYLNGDTAAEPDTNSVLTEIADFDPGASLTVAAGTAEASTAGTYELGWSPANEDYSEVAYAFNVIPEPSSLAMLLLSGLVCLTFIRRRQSH